MSLAGSLDSAEPFNRLLQDMLKWDPHERPDAQTCLQVLQNGFPKNELPQTDLLQIDLQTDLFQNNPLQTDPLQNNPLQTDLLQNNPLQNHLLQNDPFQTWS